MMSVRSGSQIREVVDWGTGERRRRRLEADLARGDVGGQSDLDLIVIVDRRERFPDRCRRFYEALEPRVGMDLLVYTPEEFEAMRDGHSLRRALVDAKVIYEA